MIIQSGSAAVGILMAVASQGLIGYDAALFILFGVNIGTCITAVLASIGTNLTARRTALAHVLFNVFGVITFLLILPIFKELTIFVTQNLMGSTDLNRLLANSHTMFNLLNTLIWLPLASVLVTIATKIFPGEDAESQSGPRYLDRRVLGNPAVALELAKKEIIRASGLAREMILKSQSFFFTGENLRREIDKLESEVDELQREITLYLSMILSQNTLSEYHSTLLAGLMHVTGDIERIGDHADKISHYAQERKEKGLDISEAAKAELEDYFQRILEIFARAVQALAASDGLAAEEIWREEDAIGQLQRSLRRNHLDRLCRGDCQPQVGIILVEVLNNLERIADHATNIAGVVEKSEMLSLPLEISIN
jgi:phosphate:Na+ symporter